MQDSSFLQKSYQIVWQTFLKHSGMILHAHLQADVTCPVNLIYDSYALNSATRVVASNHPHPHSPIVRLLGITCAFNLRAPGNRAEQNGFGMLLDLCVSFMTSTMIHRGTWRSQLVP